MKIVACIIKIAPEGIDNLRMICYYSAVDGDEGGMTVLNSSRQQSASGRGNASVNVQILPPPSQNLVQLYHMFTTSRVRCT